MITKQSYVQASSIQELGEKMTHQMKQLAADGFTDFEFSGVTVVEWNDIVHTHINGLKAGEYIQTITANKSDKGIAWSLKSIGVETAKSPTIAHQAFLAITWNGGFPTFVLCFKDQKEAEECAKQSFPGSVTTIQSVTLEPPK